VKLLDWVLLVELDAWDYLKVSAVLGRRSEHHSPDHERADKISRGYPGTTASLAANLQPRCSGSRTILRTRLEEDLVRYRHKARKGYIGRRRWLVQQQQADHPGWSMPLAGGP